MLSPASAGRCPAPNIPPYLSVSGLRVKELPVSFVPRKERRRDLDMAALTVLNGLSCPSSGGQGVSQDTQTVAHSPFQWLSWSHTTPLDISVHKFNSKPISVSQAVGQLFIYVFKHTRAGPRTFSLSYSLFLIFESVSCHIAQARLKPMILLPPWGWGYRHAPLCPALSQYCKHILWLYKLEYWHFRKMSPSSTGSLPEAALLSRSPYKILLLWMF